MHIVTFYPLGNAESCLVELENGRTILFDYANVRDPNDPKDQRADLPTQLREKLKTAGRDYFDVVAFTHLDDDHICGMADFFHLDHAKKYQGSSRIKIDVLCVPAAAIIEEGCDGDARVIRAEARHRLLAGRGVRVISQPEQLANWLAERGVSIEDRKHLITDAGQLLPEFALKPDGVEFFVHSPFASRLADGSLIERNKDALAMQATFSCAGQYTRFMITSDIPHIELAEMVRITKWHGNDQRLAWDIMDIPHHCSYLSLAGEKGAEVTEPDEDIKWLFEACAQAGAILVSSSKPIPDNDNDDQPPHRQAANYYKKCAAVAGGQFKVTMEHPSKSKPAPLVITIDGSKATLKKTIAAAAAALASRPSPRAG